jgi:hypothetical protein
MYVLLIVVCPFVLFLLTIVFSVLLGYRDSDYPFGIFKLFLVYVIVVSSNCGEGCSAKINDISSNQFIYFIREYIFEV